MFGRVVRLLRRALRPVGRILVVPARWLAHLVMLPVDVAFLFFDVLVVNLKKTRLFVNDCRGKDSYIGGVCPPARKYTNRFLFRLVCPEMGSGPHGVGAVCRAGEGVRFHLIRGACVALVIGAVTFGVYWAGVRYWPTPGGRLPDAEKIQRLFAERVREGDAALAQQDYKRARTLYLRALTLRGTDRELRYKIGVCAAELGDADVALAYFMGAVEGEAPYLPALNTVALRFYERGDIGMAGAFASRAVEAGGADAQTHAILADRYVWMDRAEDAAAQMELAQSKGATGEVLTVARAHLLMLQKDLEGAEALLEAIPEDSPLTPLAGLYRLDVLWHAGRREEAIEQFQAVAGKFSNLPWLALVLVDSEFKAGQRRQATAVAQQVAKRFADSPFARLDLAKTLSRNGEDGLALEVLDGCEQEKALRVPAAVLAGEIYLRRGLPYLAAEQSERALIAGPTDQTALMLAARVALQSGEPEQAVRHLRQVLDGAPERAETWFLLATAQKTTRDFDGAVASLQKACELQPNAGQFRLELGLALIGAGKPEQAREQLLKAAELTPRPVVPYTHLGVLAQQAGDNALAREYYGKAIQAAPERATIAANNLAELLLHADEDIPLALAFAYSA
ncbi:MAG: hypothetical protein AMK73_09435, partial [Planctomycetes bacterium SM23_32]